jgi:hypothetical protein
MIGDRAGSGTFSALVAVQDILPAPLVDLLQQGVFDLLAECYHNEKETFYNFSCEIINNTKL